MGYYEDKSLTDEFIDDVIKWRKKNKINNPYRQLNKVIEEVGELAHEICRDRLQSAEIKDAIGDVLVTVIILSDILGYDPIECLEGALGIIQKRTGHTSEGMFIKDVKDEPERQIIRNRCKCKKCGDIIESKDRHDYVECKCGAIFTDGGLDYVRRGGNVEDIEDMSEFINVRNNNE